MSTWNCCAIDPALDQRHTIPWRRLQIITDDANELRRRTLDRNVATQGLFWER